MDEGLVAVVGELDFSQQDLAEAADWMARLRADDRTENDIRVFQQWFASDTAHFAAFEHMNAVWEAVGARRPARRPQLARRGVLAGAASLAVVAGSLGFWQSAQARIYKTDVGEQKHVVLEDGTQLFLDTDTCCAVDFSKAARAVDLQYGRANLRVGADDNRDFSVHVSDSTVHARQSRFDVRRDRGTDLTMVTLMQGRAVVDVEAPRPQTEQLVPGQQLVVPPFGPVSISSVDLAQMMAWQRGQAMFENTRLADAIYEMNRYSSSKLKIADAALGDMRISGVFTFGDNDAFAGALTRLLPVRAYLDQQHHYINLSNLPTNG